MGTADIARAREAITGADLILIGASNGLDMAEGLNIFASDRHFMQFYGDLAAATGAQSILEGIFSAAGDPARLWAWIARFAQVEHCDYQPGAALRPLRRLLNEKDVFAITCNLDGRLARAGIDPAFVLETEGSALEAVCTRGCCDDRRSIVDVVGGLNASIQDGRVDERLIPRCPHCGAPLTPAIDERRLAHPDAACAQRLQALSALLDEHRNGNIVVLELGVGLRNGAIKRMLFDAVLDEPHLTYLVFNYNQIVIPHGLENCSIGIAGDMGQTFERIFGSR